MGASSMTTPMPAGYAPVPPSVPEGYAPVDAQSDDRGLYQRAKDGVSNLISPPSENIPEASFLYQKAGPEELAFYQRNEDPTAQITQDEHGNTVFEGEKGRVYPDKPGFTWKDIPEFLSDATDFTQEAAPSIAGGVVTAPVKAVPAMLAMGATGLASGGSKEGAESLAEGRGYDVSVPLVEGALNLGGEGIARGLFRLLSPVASKMFGSKADDMVLVNKSGALTDDGEKLLAQAKVTPSIRAEVEGNLDLLKKRGAVNAKEAERLELFLKHKLEPTRPQISRNADDFTRQTEALKSSGPVRNRIEGQDIALNDAFESAVPRGSQAGESAYDLITGNVAKADEAVSAAYTVARDRAPDAAIPLKGLRGLMDELEAGGNKDTLEILSVVNRELKNRGLKSAPVKRFNGAKSVEVNNRASVQQAEEVRKALNGDIYNSTSPYGRSIIRELKDAIDDDVVKVVGGDVFGDARATKAALEKSLTRGSVGRRDNRAAKGLLRDVVDNRVGRGDFLKRIKTSSTRAEDITDLKTYLGQQGVKGAESWKSIKRSVMDDIMERTFRGPLGEQGVQKPTRAALESSLKTWPDDKLAQIFDPPELAFLKDMREIMKLREAPANPMGYGPSSMGVKKHIDSAVTGLSRLVPYGGDLAEGMIKKLGEIAGDQKLTRELLEASATRQFTQRQAESARKLLTAAMKSRVTPLGGVAAGSVIAEGQD